MKDRVNKKHTTKFTTTSNKILQDGRLSYEAIGVFMYLWSMPDDWQVMVRQVMKHNNSTEYKVRLALRELRNYGYMKWKRVQGYCEYDMCEDGTFHCGDIQHDDTQHDDTQHDDIYIQSNNINKTITNTNAASGFSQNDFLESFIKNHLSEMSDSAKSGLKAFVVTQLESLSEKLNRPLTQSECLTHCKKIIDGMQHQNENPVVNDSLITQNPARDNLSRTKKPKKEIDFPQEFVEYYEAYTGLHPSKQKQTASTALTKWKIMRKTHTNAEILLQIQKYAEYLQKEDWRTKKGMQFVNEKFLFEGDWIEKKLIQEEKQQKSTNNNNYAKPKMSTTSQVAEMLKAQSQYIKNNEQINYEQDEYPF